MWAQNPCDANAAGHDAIYFQISSRSRTRAFSKVKTSGMRSKFAVILRVSVRARKHIYVSYICIAEPYMYVHTVHMHAAHMYPIAHSRRSSSRCRHRCGGGGASPAIPAVVHTREQSHIKGGSFVSHPLIHRSRADLPEQSACIMFVTDTAHFDITAPLVALPISSSIFFCRKSAASRAV